MAEIRGLVPTYQKIRVEVKEPEEAKNLQSRYGGWCVETDDYRVFWYTGYTRTQIFEDMGGTLKIY